MPETLRILVDGIVFDCDGVLVDSRSSAERAWARWATHFGLDEQAVLDGIHGRPSRETAARWLSAERVAEATDLIDALEIDSASEVAMIPGAFELLASLPAHRWAVVTSASRPLFTARMAAAGLPLPSVLVTADDVTRGKPEPDGYAAALRGLGIDGRRAAVFEDTVVGMTAARAAGVAQIIRVGVGPPFDGEAAAVADLRHVTWDGRLTLIE